MKNILIGITLVYLYFIFLVLPVSAQVKLKVNFKVKADTVNIPEYDIKNIDKSNQLVFNMKFGDSEIKNPKEAKRLTGGVIQKIELVYTNYPVDADLELLNKHRLIELYLLAPEVFDNPMTEWKFVAQTKCKSNWDASRLFHGIVITYRKAPSAESAKEEATYIKDVVSTVFKPEKDYSLKGMVKNKTVLIDSTVLKIFNRNSKWKNLLVVGDFTGSMSPYIAQVLIWHSLNIQKKAVMNFVFFNDGDMTLDSKKVTGKTGGIYDCTADNLDTVLNTAIKTITNGYGGDSPENDVEAILYGIEKFPKCEEIILIADNWANMRDYSLISKIKKPVRVILCGAQTAVNIQFLDLALQTKGSIHTIEEDIEDLVKIAEGKTIKIGKKTFRMYKGKFVPID